MGALLDIRHEIAALRDSYPSFVWQRRPETMPGEIPVFVFHTIEPLQFEAQLSFLRANGYRTIGMDEYFAILSGRQCASGGEVLLTIDDGRSSAWRYGLPLLRKYDCRAVLFVIPGWTRDGDEPLRATLEDVWRGTQSGVDLDALDPRDFSLCTWAELRTMRASGLVEVHSHSWLHRRVFVSDRLKGWIGPGSRAAPFNAAFSPYLSPVARADTCSLGDFLGLPLFEMRSVFEGVPAWRLHPQAIEECRSGHPRITSAAFIRSSAEEALCEMESEIALARDALRQNLGDEKAGVFLCLPFTLGCTAAIDIARRQGVQGCFWGIRPGQRANRPGDDPLYWVRIKNDFLWRLPGRGRRRLGRIYFDKLTRRLRGDSPY